MITWVWFLNKSDPDFSGDTGGVAARIT